jgi:hypothetical protein
MQSRETAVIYSHFKENMSLLRITAGVRTGDLGLYTPANDVAIFIFSFIFTLFHFFISGRDYYIITFLQRLYTITAPAGS